MLTILTPTYNRGYIIDKAYQSLLKQTNKNFEWVVVDDGSTDNTKELINKYVKEGKIKIKYFKKNNGGKHTALNYGIKKASGKYTIILDSDDYLTNDAVDKIYYYFNKYDSNSKISAISFLRVSKNGEKIGKKYSDKEIISNYIDFRHNKNIYGDMAEVYRTDILKKYPFPVFGKERFLSEAIVWIKIALDYDMVFVNEGIYVCEYLDDGLSKNSLKTRYNNPIGALENAKSFMNPGFHLLIRMKNAILYDGFSLIAKRNFKYIIKNNDYKVLSIIFYPAGILFKYWCCYEVKKSN